MYRSLSPLVAIALIAPVLGQTTWVVDSGGSGNFTDLPAALAAAAHGDTILVRSGLYTPATTSLGVRIVGGANRRLRGTPFVVTDLPIGRTFVLSGFDQPAGSPATPIVLRRCAGLVHLQAIASASFPPFLRHGGELSITDCAAVTLHEAHFHGRPAVRIERSKLTWTDGTAAGAVPSSSSYVAAAAVDSGVVLCGVRLWGGDGLPFPGFVAPASAVVTAGGTLRASRGALYGGTTSGFSPRFAPDIRSDGGAVVVDPNVGSGVGVRFTGTSTFATRTVPGLTAPSIALNGTIVPQWTGGIGQPSLLAASLPGRPLPSVWGDLWLDPGSTVGLYVGPARSDPPGLTLIPVFVPGTAVTLQGIVALPNELVLTNAQTLVVR